MIPCLAKHNYVWPKSKSKQFIYMQAKTQGFWQWTLHGLAKHWPVWPKSKTVWKSHHVNLSWYTVVLKNINKAFMERFEHSWTILEPSGTILNFLESYWTFLNHVEPYGALWTLLYTPEHSWTFLNFPEHFWNFKIFLNLIEPSWTFMILLETS